MVNRKQWRRDRFAEESEESQREPSKALEEARDGFIRGFISRTEPHS